MSKPTPTALACVLIAAASIVSCSSSETMTSSTPQRFTLRYDGSNANAPNLPSATYEAAARFRAAETSALPGGELIEVEFHIAFLPASATVKVYDEGTPTSPGPLLYSADVTASLTQDTWARHALATPVMISGDDLWIAIEFTHALSQRVIGCDPGPAVADGDWLYSSADGMWTPFSQRFAISVNWNIRGIVAF